MEIYVKLKSVYGIERVYPACAKAKLFASIAGQETLTAREILKIKELGYEVIVKEETKRL